MKIGERKHKSEKYCTHNQPKQQIFFLLAAAIDDDDGVEELTNKTKRNERRLCMEVM